MKKKSKTSDNDTPSITITIHRLNLHRVYLFSLILDCDLEIYLNIQLSQKSVQRNSSSQREEPLKSS